MAQKPRIKQGSPGHRGHLVTGVTWSQGSPGVTWSYLGSPGVTWSYLELPGVTWSYLGSPGVTWGHLVQIRMR